MKRMHLAHFGHEHHGHHGHAMMVRMEHVLHDPRFWAILAMIAVTALVMTLAILTRPGGGVEVEPFVPIVPGPFMY